MNTICLVAGGPEHLLPEHLEDNQVIFVGVDEGVLFLLNRGIDPIAAFGDFDSISEDTTRILTEKEINIFSFKREKDMTDLELALEWSIRQNPRRIIIYGATGGRLDHELINIQMLKKGLDGHISIEMIDTNNKIYMKKPGTYTIEHDATYPYVSFIPFTPLVTGITLEGFRYPLLNAEVEWGSTLCISNELVTKKGTYSFDDGIIMVIRSKD